MTGALPPLHRFHMDDCRLFTLVKVGGNTFPKRWYRPINLDRRKRDAPEFKKW